MSGSPPFIVQVYWKGTILIIFFLKFLCSLSLADYRVRFLETQECLAVCPLAGSCTQYQLSLQVPVQQ